MATTPICLKRHLRLKDPRINRCKRHLLIDIVTIAVCAVIANANTWRITPTALCTDAVMFTHKRVDAWDIPN